MTESAINILTLIAGFFVPYFRLVEQLAAGESAVDASGFTEESALSLLVSGMVCAIAFRMHGARSSPAGRLTSRTGSSESLAGDS
jgi:membrane protein DedA with SNARE-associated domain